jgi:hypothetical protein
VKYGGMETDLNVGDLVIDALGYCGVVTQIRKAGPPHASGIIIMVNLANPPHSDYRTSGYWAYEGLRLDVLGELGNL